MKYIGLTIVLLFMSIFALAKPTIAADDVGLDNFFNSIDGLSCGDARSDAVNRCCSDADFPQYKTIGEKFKEIGPEPVKCVPFTDFCTDFGFQYAGDWMDRNSIITSLNVAMEGAAGKSGYKPCRIGIIADTQPNPNLPGCTCILPGDSLNLCNAYFDKTDTSDAKEWEACAECSEDGIWTALGCLYTDYPTFIEKNVFGTAIGLAGFAALLCIIYSAVIIQTSQGNPEKLEKAKENITSCIVGLLLIIFSIFILRVIGVDILGLPGLS